MKNKIILLLCLISALSFFLNTFKKDLTPPCFTADEAAFAYNSYSILNTGKDEYGNFMPLKFKSFGENKLPLYTYISIPFIKFMGLNERAARSPNDLISIIIPIAVFFLAKELFGKNSIAITSAFLSAVSLGLHLIGRQASEVYPAVLFITIATIFFVKSLKKINIINVVCFVIPLLLSIFTYQSSRIFVVYFLIYSLIYLFLLKLNRKNNKLILILLIFAVLSISTINDLKFNSSRVKSLFLFSNPGLQTKTQELRIEGGSRFLYNKLTVGAREVFFNHLKYFSPQFLAISGDENTRFGYGEMYPMTPLEYLFIFIGIYFLIKNKEKNRALILSLFFIAPLSASLTWTDLSITRSLFILIPSSIISSYGFISILDVVKSKRKIMFFCIVILEFFLLFLSWNFYLNHYNKRGSVRFSMQCGYKDLSKYVKNNYNKFDKFYISPEHGQPYIFLLFYNQYSPLAYQKQAKLTPPDKYGFGQVEKFDKFIFSLSGSENKKNVSLIAYPHDFQGLNQKQLLKIKKIRMDKDEFFWIHEVLD